MALRAFQALAARDYLRAAGVTVGVGDAALLLFSSFMLVEGPYLFGYTSFDFGALFEEGVGVGDAFVVTP